MIAVALGLPDGLVFAIDGDVVKVGQDDNGRVPVALRLAGMGRGVREQLERLVAAARSVQAAPPAPEPIASVDDVERAEVAAMTAELARRKGLPAHEILGVAPDADLAEVRKAYLGLARRHHPDAHGRFRTSATRTLAAELFLGVSRAYDRLREVSPAATRVPGPAFASRGPWLTPLEPEASGVVAVPVVSESSSPYSEIQLESGPIVVVPPSMPSPSASSVSAVERDDSAPVDDFAEELHFTTSVRLKALTAEELFDDDAVTHADTARPDPSPVTMPLVESGRTALAAGRWRDACEAFAAALRVDAKDRVVRALYHVASGYEMREKGEGARALLQFETALAHHRDCDEARRALAQSALPVRGSVPGKGTRIS